MTQEWQSILQTMIEELGRDDTWTVQRDDSINANSKQKGWHQYIRNTNGRFKCSTCSRSWPSKKVMVVFHMHLSTRQRTGTVKVRFYKQKCRRCTNAAFVDPSFREENVELLLEKLTEKILIKCYREDLGEKGKPFHSDGRVEGPHERAHCEACLHGACSRGS